MNRTSMQNSLVVAAMADAMIPMAHRLAAGLGLPVVDWEQTADRLVLTVTGDRLELHARTRGRSQPLFVEFSTAIAASRRQEGLKQTLARAAGLKHGIRPRILDATPGLGRDAFVLAALGCQVWMVERSPVAAAMLEDGLRRAASLQEVANMTLVTGNAVDFMEKNPTSHPFDVIYLDPMHPERNKAALVKKEMRLLREVVGDDDDADHLLRAALACAGGRVVVKRPRLGSPLQGPPPHAVVTGRTVRYDLYFPAVKASTTS